MVKTKVAMITRVSVSLNFLTTNPDVAKSSLLPSNATLIGPYEVKPASGQYEPNSPFKTKRMKN